MLGADENDPLVIRAREVLDRVTRLVESGALPQIRLKKAQEDIQDALDMSLLKKSLYSSDLLPEQAGLRGAIALDAAAHEVARRFLGAEGLHSLDHLSVGACAPEKSCRNPPLARGVGARRSATKSAIVKSISCPTALITGIADS